MLKLRQEPAQAVADLITAVRACKLRDYNLEGIEMFLALEDLRAGSGELPGQGPGPSGPLGPLAEEYLERLAAGRKHASLEDAETALEVLAAHHFDPVKGESLRTNVAWLGGLASGPLLRAVNFHNTPRARADELEPWLLRAGELFASAGEEELDAMLGGPSEGSAETPGKPFGKPPLMLVFYEGYRNHYEVALPMLERAGLRGWFFVPTAFVDTPVGEQYAFARGHYLGLTGEDRPGRRCAMSWGELREVVARGHVVACHTATHCAVFDLGGPEDARRELIDPRQRLEEELGVEVRTLAWLLGTPFGDDPWVDTAVRRANYRRVVSGAKIQRLPELVPGSS